MIKLEKNIYLRADHLFVQFTFRNVVCRKTTGRQNTPANLAWVRHQLAFARAAILDDDKDAARGALAFDQAAPVSDSVSVGELLQEIATKTTDLTGSRKKWPNVQRAIGHVPVDTFTDEASVRDWVESGTTRDGRLWGKVNRNSYLTVFRVMFRYARVHHGIDVDPMRDYRNYQGARRQRQINPFTDSEITTLCQFANPILAALIEFVSETGIRPQEAFGLTWDCINYDDNVVLVRQRIEDASKQLMRGCKSENATTSQIAFEREIPLNDRARAALRQIRPFTHEQQCSAVLSHHIAHTPATNTNPDPRQFSASELEEIRNFVFVLPHTRQRLQSHWGLRLAFETVCNAAGVPYRSIGQFRHTFATRLITETDLSEHHIVMLLGHTSPTMLWKHYYKAMKSRETREVTAAALERMPRLQSRIRSVK